MKAVSVVGYKNSGKTTLTRKLAEALEKRGLTVAVAKYTHHSLDKPDTDTGRLAVAERTVVGLAPSETLIRWGHSRHLTDLLPLINADVLLVEGGKSLGWLPRILCLRSAGEAEELDQGLAIASFGQVAAPYLKSYREDELEQLAALVEERGFIVPGLDCGACGEADCAALSARIVKGEATLKDCLSITDTDISITINGHPVGMNPFVSRIVAASVKGMLGELKGYAPGNEVTITLSR